MKKLLLATVIFLSAKIYGQSVLLDGYYVNLSADTVKCKIYFKDWNRNPELITVEDGNGKKELSFADMTAFGIPGTDEFVKKTVSVHTNPIGGFLPDKYSDELKETTVFLKKLVDGSYSLYELKTDKRIYFFIQQAGGEIQELVYRKKQTDTQLLEDEQYKNLLILLVTQNGLPDWVESKANTVTYDSNRLTEIVNLLNGSGNSSLKKPGGKKAISFEAYAGGLIYLFPSGIQDVHDEQIKLKSAFSPAIGLAFTYLFPSRFNRLGITLSIGYSSFKSSFTKTDSINTVNSPAWYYTTNYHEKISIKGSYIKPAISVIYILNPLSKTKFYLKAGAVYNIALKEGLVRVDYSANTTGVRNGNIPISSAENYSTPYIDLNSAWINISTGAGVSIGRHRFEAEYAMPTNLSTNLNKNTKFSVGSIGLTYKIRLLN
jgi:Outer membrane protein beta-barrel domain